MRVRPLLPLFSIALAACSSSSTGSQFDSPSAAESVPGGSFAGLCIPTASVDVDRIGSRDLAPACGMSYDGRGAALSVRALAVAVAVRLGDSGELPAGGGARNTDVLDADVAGLVQARVLHGATSSAGAASLADASIADVRVGIAGHTVTAAVLQSNGRATCSDASGASIVADLRIDDVTVQVTGAPNQTIAVGPVRVVINEQVRSAGAIVVNALHVSAASIADVAIASSRASVVCPCGASSVATGGTSAGPSGGASGGSSSGGGPPSSSSAGSSDGGGASSSGAAGDVASGSSGPEAAVIEADFGQAGDACDDEHVCAAGNRCVSGAPSDVR